MGKNWRIIFFFQIGHFFRLNRIHEGLFFLIKSPNYRYIENIGEILMNIFSQILCVAKII